MWRCGSRQSYHFHAASSSSLVHQQSTYSCFLWKLSPLEEFCKPNHVPSLHLQALCDSHFAAFSSSTPPLHDDHQQQLATGALRSSVLSETKPKFYTTSELHNISIPGTPSPHPQISNSADPGVGSDSFVGKNSRVDGLQEHGSIGSILQKIVNRAAGKGPPLSVFLEYLELLAQFDPPTDKFFDDCICLSSKPSLPNAVGLYNIMRCMGHLPSSSVFTILIREHIKVGDMLQSRRLYDDMIALACSLRKTSQYLCKITTKKLFKIQRKVLNVS